MSVRSLGGLLVLFLLCPKVLLAVAFEAPEPIWLVFADPAITFRPVLVEGAKVADLYHYGSVDVLLPPVPRVARLLPETMRYLYAPAVDRLVERGGHEPITALAAPERDAAIVMHAKYENGPDDKYNDLATMTLVRDAGAVTVALPREHALQLAELTESAADAHAFIGARVDEMAASAYVVDPDNNRGILQALGLLKGDDMDGRPFTRDIDQLYRGQGQLRVPMSTVVARRHVSGRTQIWVHDHWEWEDQAKTGQR